MNKLIFYKDDGYNPEEFPAAAESFGKLGLTKDEMAVAFGVHVLTLERWCERYPDFAHAIHKGGLFADAAVANALYTSAVNGDVKAQIFWLKNRRRGQWKDKHEEDRTVKAISIKGGLPERNQE